MRKCSSFLRFAAGWVVFGSSLAQLTWTRVAHAEAAHDDRIQNVVFDDDLLNSDLKAPWGDPVFPSHPPPARTQLIRPRTNFLPELYKSVEHL
jgi:hypothetical protein